ncbi:UDP-N-acetylglucosamine 2-epimerase (hydrolyzing) [Photobacterium galatheae]|uniref:UDP-N-acetylglucosamine 2-epimerase n=1 Tax=Photobacterium galatheae TaxID=1654360 RepID=UPI00202CF9F4|nr:UDP-N-acetylglucosamine 2-epimerase [Photobacterium galatheae]MCM0147575.1 UDP-N-acetylglucosamine 2-epimerase (hydrolyzing) [Photobacterium galatheae]
MKVLALTSIRSEYDLMSSLFSKLNDDDNIIVKLLVGGAHNSKTFGLTVNDIRADGFDIMQVESLIDGDSSSSRLKSASLLMMSSIDWIKSYSPDLIIYAGDREEVLIGAMIGGYLSIPTIHFFAGDHACDGHIDNPARHAASKLSTCHFVSTEEHKNRLIAIGEPDYRIFNIGSVALDKFYEINCNSDIKNSVSKKEVKKPAALFIFHPVEEEINDVERIMKDTFDSLIESGFHIFVGMPNTDYGNSKVREVIDSYEFLDDITVYKNLPRHEFVQLFKACDLIVGNSSAGILESASIPIPCINIGLRQKGRFCGENVQFVGGSRREVLNAIEKARDPDYLALINKMQNPYGNGKASDKAYKLIKSIDFKTILAKKEDPLNNV